MCGILEKSKNLRRFLFGITVVICVVMPIAWQLKDILKILVLHQG